MCLLINFAKHLKSYSDLNSLPGERICGIVIYLMNYFACGQDYCLNLKFKSSALWRKNATTESPTLQVPWCFACLHIFRGFSEDGR